MTIILPTLAMEAKQNCMSQYALTDEDAKEAFAVEYFMTLLDEKIHQAKDMLIERFDWICQGTIDIYRPNFPVGYP